MRKERRNKEGIKVGIIGIMINLSLAITKVVLSLITNSVSIMADALNNITDTTSSLLTIIGFKIGNKKPTKLHPYGYARYEYISSFLISIFMVIMSSIFVFESLTKIIKPESLNINNTTYIILFITLIIKIIQYIYYVKMYKKLNSISIKATSVETRNDIITNLSILISMIIMKNFNINIDGYIGLVVSMLLVISSFKIFLESNSLLIGVVPNDEIINLIKSKIMSYEQVQGIHELFVHNYGMNNNYITVHLEVNKNMKLKTINKLCNKIENDFKKENYNIVIHIDPKL